MWFRLGLSVAGCDGVDLGQGQKPAMVVLAVDIRISHRLDPSSQIVWDELCAKTKAQLPPSNCLLADSSPYTCNAASLHPGNQASRVAKPLG